jgi:hypothetical protein
MAAEVVLLASLAIAATLLVVAGSRLREGLARRWGALAALPLLIALLLTLYVFGEDSYRGNGISRWDAYRSPGGALGPMFVLSLALLCGCAGLLLYAGLRGRARLLRASALAGGLVSATLVTTTILGFTLN